MLRTTALILFALQIFLTPTAYAGEASERAAAKLLHDRMQTSDPEALAILKAVADKDVSLVLTGTGDLVHSLNHF